jgi:hypothetical protein
VTRTCKYKPCGNAFEQTDSRHEYCGPTCRANQHYDDHPEKGRPNPAVPLQSVAADSLDEVWARGEEGKPKSYWTAIAREHLRRTLLETGYFNSEDFDALGIPPEHVNVGNSWIGHFSKQKLMDPISWRRSEKPSRKGGKIWIYRITDKGRQELGAGVGIDHPEGKSPVREGTLDRPGGSPFTANGAGSVVDVDSGEVGVGAGGNPVSDRIVPVNKSSVISGTARHRTKDLGGGEPSGGPALKGGGQSPESSGSVPGKGSSVVNRGTAEEPAPTSDPEPLSLLPPTPKMFDPDQRAA